MACGTGTPSGGFMSVSTVARSRSHGPSRVATEESRNRSAALRRSYSPTRVQRKPNLERDATVVVVGYVIMWALEGAARKWLPGMATIGYVARDLLLVLAIAWFFVLRHQRTRHWWWRILWISALTLLAASAVAIVSQTSTVTVSALGMRAYLAPLLFLAFCATYATSRTTTALAHALAWLVLVNLPIVVLQATSSPYASINRQVAGDGPSFINAGEVARASGTFSAPIGLGLLLPIALATSLAMIASQRQKRSLHLASVTATIVMVAVAGSRGTVLAVAIVITALAAIYLARGTLQSLIRLVGLALTVVAAGVVANALFPRAIAAFQTRFEDAAGSESAVARLLDSTFGFLAEPFPLIGDGPGSRSASGAALTGNDWVESEKLRWTAELGMIGFALAMLAVVGAAALIVHVVRRLSTGSIMAQLGLSVLVPLLLFGSITQQPSTQGGFAIAAAVIWLARGIVDGPGPGAGNGHPQRSGSRRRLPSHPST